MPPPAAAQAKPKKRKKKSRETALEINMDLSMILSPAIEEEETDRPRAPAPREPGHSWSFDELQCAVSILHDFQQPATESFAPLQGDLRDTNSVKQARFFAKQTQEYKPGETDDVKLSSLRLNDKVHMTAGRKVEKEHNKGDPQRHNVSNGVWGDDSTSKLDLLVQAGAVIKQHRSVSSTTCSSDKAQQVRSGVWSRAEEEYASALVSYFLQGLLDLAEGTTLRKFLADELCCSRRRVSMKLATESLAGQRIPRKFGAFAYMPAQHPPSDEERLKVEGVLAKLRDVNFSHSLEGGRYHSYDGDTNHSFGILFSSDEAEGEEHAFPLHHDQMRRSARIGRKVKRAKPTIIRTGFESPEEEEFVTTMFEFFIAGVLDLPEGTRLVRYLCQQLGCTSKQLSLKLAPQHMGEPKFPVNVGSITYMRKEPGVSSPRLEKDAFSEELFEVESRLTELRLAHAEAQKKTSPPIATLEKRERKSSTVRVSSTREASVASTPDASPVRSFQRSGPWSHGEEVYAAALIDCFFKGVLDIAEGTTLRAFLSSRLCCNPMRISKKLSSESIADIRIPKKLGSSTYVLHAEVTPEEQADTEESLQSLQDMYLHSSTRKRGSVLGSKRPRSSVTSGPRLQAAARVGTDSEATESDSKAHSAGNAVRETPKDGEDTRSAETAVERLDARPDKQ